MWAVAVDAMEASRWVVYGTFETKGHAREMLFFDSNNIKRNTAGNVEVWTKGLSEKKLHHLYDQSASAAEHKGVDADPRLDAIARRILEHEPLMYQVVEPESVNDAARIALMYYEVVADEGKIEPTSRTLLEIDCNNEMYRVLSGDVTKSDGHTALISSAGPWDHTPPETNGARLSAMVCKRG
jgi:hypothetical protein